MLWFSRAEFQRYTWYYAAGSVRDTFDFNLMQQVEFPSPDIEIQQDIVNIFETYNTRRDINEKLKAQLESGEKKDTSKPTQNPTPSPTENQSADNNSTYELTAGDYEIPGDIPAGKYDIIAISGEGEFILDGNDNFIDERMSPNVEENSYAIKERKNASLKDGNSITINYTLKVQLVPKNQ